VLEKDKCNIVQTRSRKSH